MLENLVSELNSLGKVQFYVRARPGMSQNQIVSIMDDESIKIDIAAPAEGGKANAELIKYIAREFGVDVSRVKIVSGATSRMKLIRVS